MIFSSGIIFLALGTGAVLASPLKNLVPRAGSLSIIDLVTAGVIPSSVLKEAKDNPSPTPADDGSLHPDGDAKCDYDAHKAADSSTVTSYFKALSKLVAHNPNSNVTIEAQGCVVLGCQPAGDVVACNRGNADVLAFHRDFVHPGIAAVAQCTDVTNKVRCEQAMTGGVIVLIAAPPEDKPYCGI